MKIEVEAGLLLIFGFLSLFLSPTSLCFRSHHIILAAAYHHSRTLHLIFGMKSTRLLFHLFKSISFDKAISFVFRQCILSPAYNRSIIFTAPPTHGSTFCAEAIVDDSKDIVVKLLERDVSAREWMGSIEQCEGPWYGVGAYTVLRCDAAYSTSIRLNGSKGIRWHIWGIDYHMDRLCTSYCKLIDSESASIAHQTMDFDESKKDTDRVIKTLLDKVPRWCVSDHNLESDDEMHRTLMLTVLWTPSKSDNSAQTPVLRAHASFAGSVRATFQDQMPVPMSACLGLPEKLTQDDLAALPARYTNGEANSSQIISAGASAKVSSWCRFRRPLEDQSRYKIPEMNVGEVLLVNQYKNTTTDFIESLEVLEGLTSNFFVIYKDGTVRTAPANKVLPGYSRHLVMKALQKKSLTSIDGSSLKLDERAPTVQDALDGLWSEVFVTSSIRLVIPVNRVLIPSYYNGGPSGMAIIWHGDGFEHTALLRSAEFQMGIDESSIYLSDFIEV